MSRSERIGLSFCLLAIGIPMTSIALTIRPVSGEAILYLAVLSLFCFAPVALGLFAFKRGCNRIGYISAAAAVLVTFGLLFDFLRMWHEWAMSL